MNNGEMFLSIAGFILLGNLILNVHKANTERMLASYTNEAVIVASGLAQSAFDEIQMKAFDENTVSKAVSSVDSLTSAQNLDAESGEIYNTDYDDVDDYNGYIASYSFDRMGNFTLTVSVTYVDNLNPTVQSNTPTFAKHVQISITNYNLSFANAITFDHIITY